MSYQISRHSKDDKLTEINFESILHNRFPIADNVTRITGVKGKWIMENMGNGLLNITYTISSHRSKKLPRWVSDSIIHNNLFASLASFKNLIEK